MQATTTATGFEREILVRVTGRVSDNCLSRAL
jgi:hypothetical protein